MEKAHGSFGSDANNFVRILEAQPVQHGKKDLALLALLMESSDDDVTASSDAEENMYVPAGYTYLGQFIDHDLTFDTTSTFDSISPPTNLRTPRLDLDCVYGKGPIDQPYLYELDGATIKLGERVDPNHDRLDLQRDENGRAIVGDPRNDENSLVSQIQASMIRFHNAQVAQLSTKQGLKGAALFDAARCHTRLTYQRIVVDDYLKRIIDANMIEAFDTDRKPNKFGRAQNEAAFVLYPRENRAALPIEFGGAAYRFGHSMIRNGYILSPGQSFPIFDGRMDEESLVGFQKLPASHLITDWRRFFPNADLEADKRGNTLNPAPGTAAGNGGKNDGADDAADKPRLQFAYRIDTSIVNPLAALPTSVADDPPPSLIVRNLWRGAAFNLPTGQDFEERLLASGKFKKKLDSKHLVTRTELRDRNSKGEKQFQFKPIDPAMQQKTPLWFYILAEAQQAMVDRFGSNIFDEGAMRDTATDTAAQLGPVGGRILLEVFHGMLDSDPDSYRNHPKAKTWQPDAKMPRMWHVVTTL